MARITLEENLEHQLLKKVEDAEAANKAADEQDVDDWLNNPLTHAMIDTIEADLLGLSLGFVTNTMTLEQRKLSQAKIEVFNQIRSYLESGESWLEKIKEEREDAGSERALRAGEAEQDS